MGKISIVLMAAIFIITSTGLSQWSLPSSGISYLGKHELVTIGTQPVESASLIYIAEDRGFFDGNGLYVAIRDDYSSGADTVCAVENGDIDISVSAEYPVVVKAFKGGNISVIACTDKYEGTYLAACKGRGFKNITDLRGKRIGVLRGTEGEFYLGRYLELHGMSLEDVTPVRHNPLQSAEALANGSVDALVVDYGLIGPIQKRLHDDDVMICPQQNHQAAFAVMACRKDWAAGHTELLKRFLISLTEAEEYCTVHPKIARSIIQKRLNRDDKYMSSVWPMHQLSLSLDQSLILAMEDEARWMIKNNLTTQRAIPDFRDYIYTKCLEEIKPESVNMW